MDNTEILDFLSRVPSKKEMFEYRELKLDSIGGGVGGTTGTSGLSGSSSGGNMSSGNLAQSPQALRRKKKA